jgi:hypothetical protein
MEVFLALLVSSATLIYLNWKILQETITIRKETIIIRKESVKVRKALGDVDEPAV